MEGCHSWQKDAKLKIMVFDLEVDVEIYTHDNFS